MIPVDTSVGLPKTEILARPKVYYAVYLFLLILVT